MNNNLIPYEELGLSNDKLEIINQFCYYKKQVESFEKELKEKFKELVEDGTIPTNSIDLGGVILSYTKSYTKKQVDSDLLKENGIYDQYTKTIEVKSSASMKVKEGEK